MLVGDSACPDEGRCTRPTGWDGLRSAGVPKGASPFECRTASLPCPSKAFLAAAKAAGEGRLAGTSRRDLSGRHAWAFLQAFSAVCRREADVTLGSARGLACCHTGPARQVMSVHTERHSEPRPSLAAQGGQGTSERLASQSTPLLARGQEDCEAHVDGCGRQLAPAPGGP